MERTRPEGERLIDVMKNRILPTAFTVAFLLNIAAFEIGPMAAPTTTTTTPPAPGPVMRPATAPPTARAKYEPIRGAYLGAALDFSQLTMSGSKVGPMADLMGQWEKDSWRENAIYIGFQPFPHEDGSFPTFDSDPKDWAPMSDFFNACAALDAAPLMTLEPLKPRVFVDGWEEGSEAYEATRALAMKIGKWNKPAFIRFGHEMNGSWYAWSEWNDKNKNMRRDPGEDTGFTAADYRKAFRNTALIFRKYAPNVALVWCPNSGLLGGERRDVYGPWYPGDDVVDWVGLDIYERGWTMPMPGAHLWGGQLAYNLTRDMADDPSTPDKNESVNFYETYSVKKNKPFFLCETGSTLSFRSDLKDEERALFNHQWKAGFWNDAEYGWLQQVYGTSGFKDHKLLQPIDRAFPKIKAVAWFQIGKHEYIPVEKTTGKKTEVVWFDDAWADYRIGGAAKETDAVSPYAEAEMDLFRRLTNTTYFLPKIVK